MSKEIMGLFSAVVKPRFDHQHAAARIDSRILEKDPERCLKFLIATRRAHWMFEHLAPLDGARQIRDLTMDIRAVRDATSTPEPVLSFDTTFSRLFAARKIPELACHAYAHYRVNSRCIECVAPVVRYSTGVDLRCAKNVDEVIENATAILDILSDSWSTEQRDRCIDEIPFAFEKARETIVDFFVE